MNQPRPSDAPKLDYYDPARQNFISEHDCDLEDGEWWFGHGMPCRFPGLHMDSEVSRERDAATSTIDRIDTALRGDGRSAMLIVTAQEIINHYREGQERHD